MAQSQARSLVDDVASIERTALRQRWGLLVGTAVLLFLLVLAGLKGLVLLLALGLAVSGAILFEYALIRRARASRCLSLTMQSQLAAVLDGSPDAIVGIHRDGRITFWNQTAERLLAVRRTEAIGEVAHLLLTPLVDESHSDTLLAAIRTPMTSDGAPAPVQVGEISLRTLEGSHRVVELTVSHHAQDAQWHTILYIRDIEAHKRSERELLAAKRQLLDVTDNLPVAVYQFRMVDGKSSFPFANRYWNQMGLPPEVVMADPHSVFVLNHEADWPGVQESIREAVVTGNTWRKEMRIRFPDGNYRWMLGVSKPIPHPEGGVIFSGYWQDIHEAKLQALRLEEVQIAAEAARRQLIDPRWPLKVLHLWPVKLLHPGHRKLMC